MIRALLALCLAAPAPAAAGGLDAAETATLPRLIASACFDLVPDRPGCETAILMASATEPDRADLVVLTDRRGDPAVEPLLVARGIAFNGAMFGMQPRLAQAANGSLLLTSENSGVGRTAWTETLTLAFRDGGFVVAGLTWQAFDRITGGAAGCDLNLLTGDYAASAQRPDAGTVLSETGRLAGARIAAADWVAQSVFPAPCAEAEAALSEG